MRTTMMVGMTALLFALPVAAQQAPSQAPAPSGTAAPRGPGGPAMMGGQEPGGRMGGMGMMGRSERHAADEDDDDDDNRTGPMRGWHHGHGGHGAPMQIIINIGPDNRVEVDGRGPRGASAAPMGGRMMMWGERHGRAMVEHAEARLNALRDELRLTPEQQPAWDRFAGAVREAVGRMRPGPEAMTQGQTLEQRLAAREATLTTRLEAVRAIHGALSGLTGSLNETQRRTLDEHAAVSIPGIGRMQSGMR